MQKKIKIIFYQWKAHTKKRKIKIENFAKALDFNEKTHLQKLFAILKENSKKTRIFNKNNANDQLFGQRNNSFVKNGLIKKIRNKILRKFFILWNIFIERKQKRFLIKRKVNNLYAFKLLTNSFEFWKLYIRNK